MSRRPWYWRSSLGWSIGSTGVTWRRFSTNWEVPRAESRKMSFKFLLTSKCLSFDVTNPKYCIKMHQTCAQFAKLFHYCCTTIRIAVWLKPQAWHSFNRFPIFLESNHCAKLRFRKNPRGFKHQSIKMYQNLSRFIWIISKHRGDWQDAASRSQVLALMFSGDSASGFFRWKWHEFTAVQWGHASMLPTAFVLYPGSKCDLMN